MNSNIRLTNARHAFTLVELLVVIGIIALLISILLPSLNKARQQATLVSCQSNLRSIGQLCQIYAAEHKGIGPAAWNNTYFTTFADALTIKATGVTATAPSPGQPAGAQNFDAATTLAIFHDVDLPDMPWAPRSSAYIGNIRAMGAYGIWDVVTNSAAGFKPRQLGGIKRSSEVMYVWCGPCDIGTGTNYGTYVAYPNGLDDYQMYGGHGLLYPDPAQSWAFQPAWYSNQIGLGSALTPGSNPSSKIPGSVTKSYLKAANNDYTNSGVYNGPGGFDTNYMRFRHINNTTANFLYADGHVDAKKLGEVTAKDVCLNK